MAEHPRGVIHQARRLLPEVLVGNIVGEAVRLDLANVDADINRDGEIGSIDNTSLLAQWSPALTAGALSAFDNAIGYGSYHHDSELLPGRFLARHRVYSPHLGCWQQRDPLGYVDGGNLYEYGVSSPAVFTDPLGLTVDNPFKFVIPAIKQFFNQLLDSFTNSALGQAIDALLRFLNNAFGSGVSAGYGSGTSTGGSTSATGESGVSASQDGSFEGGRVLDPNNLSYEEQLWVVQQLGYESVSEFILAHMEPAGPAPSFLGILRDEVFNGQEIGYLQIALDGIGFVPVVGAAADVLNAGIYAAGGNYAMASVNLAAAVPGAGDAIKASAIGARLGNVILKEQGRDALGRFIGKNAGELAPGSIAERAVSDAIARKSGFDVVGSQVRVRDAAGNVRQYDHIAQTPSGRLVGVEVESGAARLTSSQRSFDRGINSAYANGAVVTSRGALQGQQIQRAITVRHP